MSYNEYILYGSDRPDGPQPPAQWPNDPRSPILAFPGLTASQPPPPWASCWSDLAYTTALPPGLVPTTPTLRFGRGNVIGVRVPGLPPIPGGCDADPSLLITWFLDRYPSFDDAVRAIRWYAIVCGYTKINLSIPQSKYNFG